MVATLARSGSNWFQLNNKRSFDACRSEAEIPPKGNERSESGGQIRNGAQTGDPKNRYCGSLGHQQDDESGLIYMRARYYEPGCGRFISEDTNHDGKCWFVYARNNPVSNVDKNGNDSVAWALLGNCWPTRSREFRSLLVATEPTGDIKRPWEEIVSSLRAPR